MGFFMLNYTMTRSQDLDNIAPDDPIISDSSKADNQKETVSPKQQPSDTEEIYKKIYSILGHTKNPLSSFLVRPKVLSFAERDNDEEIYLAVRSHWITNFKWMLAVLIMFFIPFFFHLFNFLTFLPSPYRLVGILFWYLFTFMFAFERFLDLFLVTNERIVDIDFNNLLNKHFAEADLNMIQDVSSSVKGIMGTFFNYGDVLIQTAAEINQINFEKVPNPEKIIKLLKELRQPEEAGGNKNV